MNLIEIWSGTDYAWYEWKGRNEQFRFNAPRVKAIRAFKRKEPGKQRETGYVEVMLLDEDGNPRERSDGSHFVKEVRARDIAMRWEEYADERDYRTAQRDKIAKEQQEREEEENKQRSEFAEKLIEKFNIPPEAISMITPTGVHLNRGVLERVLNE